MLYKDEDGWHYSTSGCGCCSSSYGGDYNEQISHALMKEYQKRLRGQLEAVKQWFRENKLPKKKEVGKQ